MPVRNAVYWQDHELPDDVQIHRGHTDVDVCIVGAGFTGLWTAWNLLANSALSILVLDAGRAGGAASGTADGFVTPTMGKDLEHVVARYGIEGATAVCDAVGRSILDIGRFLRRERVAADWEPNDYLMVAVDAAQEARLERARALSARLGPRFETQVLDADATRAHIDSPMLRASIRTGGALIDPHKLARGLLRVLRARGVRVHERSPALGVEGSGPGGTVRTPHGTVRAQKIVLATGAHQHHLAGYRRRVLPVWSYAMVSEPLTDAQLGRVHWPGREGLVEAKTFLRCGRFTADGRILWAGGPARYHYGRDMSGRRVADRKVFDHLQDSFTSFFPAWRDVRFSHAYGGCVDITRDFVPHFGTSRPGILHGYGYCGNGIAATHVGGRILGDLVMEKETEHTALPFVDGRQPSFPPEPLAFLLGRVGSRAIEWKDARR